MYEIFKRLMDEKKVTPYRVSKETGIATATLSDWKNGKSAPKTDKLQKIANYFDVSIDYLLGKTDIKKPPTQNVQEDDVEPMLNDLKSKAAGGITLMYDGKPIDKKTMRAFEASLEAAIALLEASKKEDD